MGRQTASSGQGGRGKGGGPERDGGLMEGGVEPALAEDGVEAGRTGASVGVTATSVGDVDVAAVGLYGYAIVASKAEPHFESKG